MAAAPAGARQQGEAAEEAEEQTPTVVVTLKRCEQAVGVIKTLGNCP